MSYQPEWPTREQWAEQTRTFYYDIADGARDSVSTLVTDYATQEEIATAIGELRGRWSELGRRLRELNKRLQPFANALAFYDLSEEQQRLHSDARDLRDQRQAVNKLAKEWANPYRGKPYFDRYLAVGLNLMTSDGACPIFRSIVSRWGDAKDAKVEAARIRTENAPIDDEAWAKELESRAKLERYFAEGPIVHRVGGQR
jgi:DNA repair exonuclease SbcCD ATPase subunit